LLSAAFLGMAATVGWYNVRQRSAVDAGARRELAAICDAKTIQIENWRRERLGDGRLFQALSEMRAAERMLSGRGTAADRQELETTLYALQDSFLYADASLVDPKGNVAMRLGAGRTEQAAIIKKQRAELAAEAMAAKTPVLSDITLESRARTPLMTLTIPVAASGALILEIDPSTFLYPYMRSWPTTRRSGETLLARREGDEVVYLSELRQPSATNGLARQSLKGVKAPPAERLREGVLARGEDYRGAKVLAHIRQVPDSGWFVIAKVDEAEVREPIARLAWELSGILALIAVANGIGIGLIWKSHQLRMRHETEERFRSIANETPALLWMAGPDGSVFFVNRRLGVFLGLPEKHAAVRRRDFVHPEDAAGAKAQSDAAFATRTRLSYEARMRRADGAYRWVLAEGLPRTAPDGEFLGYAGALLDITERKIAEQKLRDANRVLAEGLAEKTEKEAEIRALSSRLIHAQEEERRRLSRELHDDLSQQIAALSIATGNLKRAIPAEQSEARGQSDRIQQKLVDLSESVRRMSHELHPAILQHSGLGPALRGFCREFGAVSGIQVKLRVAGELGAAQPVVSLSVFRIVQEALRNVAKHAQVNEAEVEVIHTGEEIQLTVSDGGVGFAVSGSERPAGLGLVSIRERTRVVGGTVEIESEPGRGTRLIVRIPDGGQARPAKA
jgi:PAS domain S-box-containing protein